ncbi:MAG: SPOR domain-containing protein [Brevinemataceae bacterium]
MAKIKFLDVLEETKAQSSYRNEDFEERKIYNPGSQNKYIDEDNTEYISSESSRSFKKDNFSESEYGFRARNTDLSDRGGHGFSKRREVPQQSSDFAFESGYHRRRSEESVKNPAPSFVSDGLGFADNKSLWTGALFVFFGGMLFLSGYWLGKNITGRVKTESTAALNKIVIDTSKESATDLPDVLVQDSQAKALPVITPALPPKVKPVAKKPVAAPAKTTPMKEYVIQVSAHSSIDSARRIEDQLRSSGYSAYISESAVGDVLYFRVRIRGFNNKNEASAMLDKIKQLGLGVDGYVLTLE